MSAVAIGVEQFRRELAEPQALLHMPLGGPEAFADLVDRPAAVDQRGHGDKFVGRVHGGAHRVFHQGRFDGSVGFPHQARHWVIGVDDAFGCELLQDRRRLPPASTR